MTITEKVFLSTPSARRATLVLDLIERAENISIHALREEGDAAGLLRNAEHHISIHALREEGDPHKSNFVASRKWYFYPRPPRGGRQFKNVA